MWRQRDCATFMDDGMTNRQVPDDFPREPDPGAVTGAQPKILVRKVDGRYQTAITDEEVQARYDACEDLAAQLCEYALRKVATSGLAPDVALSRAEKGLRAKVNAGQWDFSQCEVDWLVKRTRQLLASASE
ncbi:hypothetical protein X894_343 [Burkholderia pseudomallei MSHR4462]|nr:hypothetical protein X894_343 [Burkholderia pseudomallei MSHR4462]KGX04529.1 hypothetical protein Y601_5287 [Burkholderia pseudomallei MSHR640]